MREKSRLSKAKWLALAALLAAVVGAGATAKWARVAQAAPNYPGPQECNNEYSDKTLAGCFGWQSTAFVGYSTTQATAAIGLMHLDGAGNLTGWYSGSYLGSATVRNYTGSYWVNPNGTGHLRFADIPGGAIHEYDFVIVNRGNEVLMSSTLNDGTIQNVEMKRQ
ncbi:MAG TPA: hypothetical protein VF297_18755 [Pyrinomonadaceae bacterium]